MDERFKDTLNSVLAENKLCSLATNGPHDLWVATTYFAQQGLDLVCLLTHGTKTLVNVRDNPKVSLTIDNGNPMAGPFLQAKATASLMEPPDERARGEALLKEKIPEIAGFMARPNYDIIRLSPTKLYLTDFTQGWFPAREVEL